jgi:hypothetical protein
VGGFFLCGVSQFGLMSVSVAKGVHWPDLFFRCMSHVHVCFVGSQAQSVWNAREGSGAPVPKVK